MLNILFPRLITVVAATALLFCNPAHCETNRVSPHIVTNFVDGAKLSPEQVDTILQLATKAGLKQPGEVQTFRWKPSWTIGIRVRGAEKEVEGRISYQEVLIDSKRDGASPVKDALELGNFWVNPPFLRTNYLYRATFNGKTQKIPLDGHISAGTADKIFAGFDTALSKYWPQNTLLETSKLTYLAYDKHSNEYILTLSYENGWRVYIIRCKLKDSELLVISIDKYVV